MKLTRFPRCSFPPSTRFPYARGPPFPLSPDDVNRTRTWNRARPGIRRGGLFGEKEKRMKTIDPLMTAHETETLTALCTELVLARHVVQILRSETAPRWIDHGPTALALALDDYERFLLSGEQRIVPDCFLPRLLQGKGRP